MGIYEYDPYQPTVRGLSWVPIRDDFVELDPLIEYGYSFTVTGSPVPGTASVRIIEAPTSEVYSHVPFVQIYPRGEETNTGPIQSMAIGVTTTSITGTATAPTPEGPYSLSGTSQISFSFQTDSASVSDALNNRRILGVNLIYTAYGDFGQIVDPSFLKMRMVTVANKVEDFGQVFTGPLTSDQVTAVQRASLGEINPQWLPGGQYAPDRVPWRYTELRRFSNIPGDQVFVNIQASALPAGVTITFTYLALEVFYCEENRVRYGGTACSTVDTTPNSTLYQTVQSVPLYDVNLQVTGGLLPGDYTATITLGDTGVLGTSGDKPKIGGTRQLYEIPTHPGVLIERPQQTIEPRRYPMSNTAKIFIDQRIGNPGHVHSSDTLPGIDIGLSGETGRRPPHTYMNHFGAPVYYDGANNVYIAQSIANFDAISGSWDQIRFYARYFGDPRGAALRATSSINNGTATITRAEFDQLTEIIDGWKEVTLTLSAPVTGTGAPSITLAMVPGTGSIEPQNQWQIIGVNTWSDAAGQATYGGTTYKLTWASPSAIKFVVVADTTADGVVMLSQSPPAVTGLAVSTQTQQVTGIGTDCGVSPDCIPTGINFHAVSWSVSGTGTVCDTFTRDFPPALNADPYFQSVTALRSSVLDTFTRTVTGGWDGADTGQTWTTSGGSASDYSVNGTQGLQSNGTVNVTRTGLINAGTTDQTVTVDITNPVVPTGASITHWVVARATDVSNYYVAQLVITTAGVATLILFRRVGGTLSAALGSASIGTHVAGDTWRVTFQVIGTKLWAKAWKPASASEPNWQIQITDTVITSGTQTGVLSRLETGNTNTLPVVISHDNFKAMITSIGSISDTFTRTVSNGWGTTDTGETWTMLGGLASDYSVTGTRGRHSHGSAVGTDRRSSFTTPMPDLDITIGRVTISAAASGSNSEVGIRSQYDTVANSYNQMRVFWTTGGTVTVNVNQTVNGATTVISAFPVVSGATADTPLSVRFQAIGTMLRAKVWLVGQSEPITWNVELTLPSTLPAGSLAIRSLLAAGNTNTLPVIFEFDDLLIDGSLTYWTGVGGTNTRGTSQPYIDGTTSGLLIPDGVSAAVETRSELIPVTPSGAYRAFERVYSAVTRSIAVAVNWYDSFASFISQSTATVSVPAFTWTSIDLTTVAPTGAAQARLVAGGMSGTPPTSNIVYINRAQLTEGGWGAADTGQTWVPNTRSQFYTDGTVGKIIMEIVNGRRMITAGSSLTDVDVVYSVSTPVTATGAGISASALIRYTSSSDHYYLGVRFETDGTITALIVKRVADVDTTLRTVATGVTYTPNTFFRVRARVVGSMLKIRVWDASSSEPIMWHAMIADTAITAAGAIGIRAFLSIGNTNTLPVVLNIDDFRAVPPGLVDATYELQRRDELDTDWHTIMTTTNPCVDTFKDYEARIGVQSRYRIRILNMLDFAGPWSTEAINTLPTPGVTGATDGILIFTSNERQSGILNLAHSMSWDRNVEESFDFIEAGEVQIQRMFGRDFQVAFRPIERGGVRFQRTLLVQAAAVSPWRLDEEFRELRDMAWADVPYICVRDENGNRWLATIVVPGGVVTSSRRLHLTEIDIIETTATPSPVNVEMP